MSQLSNQSWVCCCTLTQWFGLSRAKPPWFFYNPLCSKLPSVCCRSAYVRSGLQLLLFLYQVFWFRIRSFETVTNYQNPSSLTLWKMVPWLIPVLTASTKKWKNPIDSRKKCNFSWPVVRTCVPFLAHTSRLKSCCFCFSRFTSYLNALRKTCDA